ncbi:MAG: hypothetical protein IPM68_01500 [Flavobacteriales bacterium]|nr:hypothetical protein [Flavobacteriales bacterium]
MALPWGAPRAAAHAADADQGRVLHAAHHRHRCGQSTSTPYLLRDLKIERRNQVWAVDITYLPVKGGFMYMVAVIDVHTRYLLNWSISNTMEGEWVTA